MEQAERKVATMVLSRKARAQEQLIYTHITINCGVKLRTERNPMVGGQHRNKSLTGVGGGWTLRVHR